MVINDLKSMGIVLERTLIGVIYELWLCNKRYWPFIVCTGLLCITWLSLKPPYVGPPGIPGIDKVQHLLAWGMVALPIVVAKPKGVYGFLLLLWLASGLIECVQPYFQRTFDVLDLLANGTGIALALYGGERGVIRVMQLLTRKCECSI
ncbi:VanZ family protein [Planctobacterium marinum]|uniref:VanZ-like domain-containing protein n=1 Tax=Planctobacterium marinum TaxID=1631968 RepID=A0AA48I109_9ALTE|nr:hypothetical protein MACH26_37810 [Planctobacterium marinum]